MSPVSGLMGAGMAIYLTEMWRDPAGRGSLFHGALDGPQIAAVLLVLAGALVLRERKAGCAEHRTASSPPAVPVAGTEARHDGFARLAARIREIDVPAEARGQRLDRFLAMRARRP